MTASQDEVAHERLLNTEVTTTDHLENGETGIYLLMPVLEPGYYHFMLGAEPDKDIPKDTDMNYVFYYQFTPEGTEW